MRCPYCQQNIRVQGRFCPKCGEQIFGLPVRPQGPGTPGAAAPAPEIPAPIATPLHPPYRPFPTSQPPPPDLTDGLGIEIEPEAPPPLSEGAAISRPAVALGSPHPAASEEVGKTCPYCRFPLKPGEQVITCPACRLPHHADCWTENRGCTTYGCRGGGGAIAPSPYGRPPTVPSTLSPTGGQVPAFDYLQANELSARANNALILAIIGLLCACVPVGIVGMFMGIAVLADVNRLRSRAGDARPRAITAIVLGIVAIVGWAIYLIVMVSSRDVQ